MIWGWVMVFDRVLVFRVLLDGRIWFECVCSCFGIFWVAVLGVLGYNWYRDRLDPFLS